MLSCTIALKDTRKPSSSRCSCPSHYTPRSHSTPISFPLQERTPCISLPDSALPACGFHCYSHSPFLLSPPNSAQSSTDPPGPLSASQLSPSLSEEHEFPANALIDTLSIRFLLQTVKKGRFLLTVIQTIQIQTSLLHKVLKIKMNPIEQHGPDTGIKNLGMKNC